MGTHNILSHFALTQTKRIILPYLPLLNILKECKAKSEPKSSTNSQNQQPIQNLK